MDMFKQEIIFTGIAVLLFSCDLEVIPDEINFKKNFEGIDTDVGFAVRQTQDGGYIITGYTYSIEAGGSDVYLIKTDAYGEVEQ